MLRTLYSSGCALRGFPTARVPSGLLRHAMGIGSPLGLRTTLSIGRVAQVLELVQELVASSPRTRES